MSEIDLLAYRNLKFSTLLKAEDLQRLRADAEKLKLELAGLGVEKAATEAKITALSAAQRRLLKFLEQVSSES